MVLSWERGQVSLGQGSLEEVEALQHLCDVRAQGGGLRRRVWRQLATAAVSLTEVAGQRAAEWGEGDDHDSAGAGREPREYVGQAEEELLPELMPWIHDVLRASGSLLYCCRTTARKL
jgi:hypothetical protein